MPFDYKKEYKEFYLPSEKPVLVTIPSMNYIASGVVDLLSPKFWHKKAESEILIRFSALLC